MPSKVAEEISRSLRVAMKMIANGDRKREKLVAILAIKLGAQALKRAVEQKELTTSLATAIAEAGAMEGSCYEESEKAVAESEGNYYRWEPKL